MRQSFAEIRRRDLRKIKSLQKVKLRNKTKIKIMKKTLFDLKSNKLLSEDSFEILNNISLFQKELKIRQLNKKIGLPTKGNMNQNLVLLP